MPDPASLLRHRGRALLVARIVDASTDRIDADGASRAWHWAELLDGAAQAAGLLAGMDPLGRMPVRVVAGYDDVVIHRSECDGTVRFTATAGRALLDMRQFRVQAVDARGGLLVEATVTLAAAR